MKRLVSSLLVLLVSFTPVYAQQVTTSTNLRLTIPYDKQTNWGPVVVGDLNTIDAVVGGTQAANWSLLTQTPVMIKNSTNLNTLFQVDLTGNATILGSGAFGGPVTLPGAPTAANQAATKQYVDTNVGTATSAAASAAALAYAASSTASAADTAATAASTSAATALSTANAAQTTANLAQTLAAGAAATVGVGVVTTLPPGSSASVANTGTTSNAVLAFGIPAGAAGAAGPAGPAGPTGPAGSSSFNGTRDAYTAQTTPTSNNGIANAIATAGIGGRVSAGANYANTEAADFDPFVQSVVHDRRVGRDSYYYRDPLGPNQGALAINCALTQRFTTNHYEAQGCFSTAAYYFGFGNNQGGGVTYNAVDRVLTAMSYVPGIQSTGDEYIAAAHSGDAHSHYRYISYGGDNRDLSGEGIQIDPAHMTQFANVFHGTVASVIDQRHVRVTPLYGQEIGGTYLIDQTVADSGLIIADNTSVAPEELTTSTTHSPSTAYGLTTTAIPIAADATNGTSVAVTVNVTSASPFAATGEACLLGPQGHEEVAYTATAISSGLQVLTAPFRYTEAAGALISQGACQYLRVNSELQIDGSGNVTSDPYYVIAGARDSTHYWVTVETTMSQGGIFIYNSPARLPVHLTSSTSSRTSAGVVTTVFPLVANNYSVISTLAAFPQLSATGCVDTSFNFALQPVTATLGLDGLTMTYTQPLATTAGSTTSCVYTSGGLNAYEVHNGAEVQSVSDPAVNPTVANASAPVNGYYALAPNTVTWASKPVEQPMSARLGINNQLRWDQQTASTPGQNSSLIHWILNGQGTGGMGVTPFRVDNYDPCNKYVGCGGTWPTGSFMAVGGPYSTMFDVMAPMLNGTTLNIECPWVGCASSVPYNVTASLGLGGASTLNYTPSTNSYGFNTNGFTVNASTIAIPHIDLNTGFSLNAQPTPSAPHAALNLNDNEPSKQYMVPENIFCTNQANGQDCLINLGHSEAVNDSAYEFYLRSSNAAQQQLGFGFSQNAPLMSLFGNGHLSLGTGDNGFAFDIAGGSLHAGSLSAGSIAGTSLNVGAGNITGSLYSGTVGGTGSTVAMSNVSPDMTGQLLYWNIPGDVVKLRRNLANTGMEIVRNTGSEFTVLDTALNQSIGVNGYLGQIDPATTIGTNLICQANGTNCPAGVSLPTGTAGQLLYYAANGTTVTPLTLGPNLSITTGTLNASSTAATNFSAVTTGTNTTAAMTVGTGGSIAATGSGTIAATSVPYSGLTGTVPTWNQSTTGTAANITATTNATLTSLTALTLPYTQVSGTPTIPAAQVAANLASATSTGVTGILPVANGGTGSATIPTWNQSTTGNAATATNSAAVGGITVTGTPATGNVLTATSTTAANWQAATGGGNTTSTSLVTNTIPKASGANAIVNSLLSDNATTLAYTGTGGVSAVSFTSTDTAHNTSMAFQQAAGGVDVLPTQVSGKSYFAYVAASGINSADGLGGFSPILNQSDIVAGAGVTVTAAGKVLTISATGSSGPSAFATLTDGATVTWAAGSVALANATLTMVHTTATRAVNITGMTSGTNGVLVIKQDATGGAALTLGTGCTWYLGGSTGFVASTTPTLTTTANAINILAFTYDGTNCYGNVR